MRAPKCELGRSQRGGTASSPASLAHCSPLLPGATALRSGPHPAQQLRPAPATSSAACRRLCRRPPPQPARLPAPGLAWRPGAPRDRVGVLPNRLSSETRGRSLYNASYRQHLMGLRCRGEARVPRGHIKPRPALPALPCWRSSLLLDIEAQHSLHAQPACTPPASATPGHSCQHPHTLPARSATTRCHTCQQPHQLPASPSPPFADYTGPGARGTAHTAGATDWFLGKQSSHALGAGPGAAVGPPPPRWPLAEAHA